MMNNPTELTASQKLAALSLKYYSGYKWEPKTGDYYTLPRADLELYQVVEATETTIKTKYCNPKMGDTISEWEREKFLTGWGQCRTHVTLEILSHVTNS